MGIFSKLKPQKIVNSLFQGVDKSILTKEELLDISIKQARLNLEFVKATQTESTPRALARRIIAIIVISQYCLSFNIGVLGIITAWFDGVQIIKYSSECFGSIALAVIIFYFGNHIVSNLTNKFGNQKK